MALATVELAARRSSIVSVDKRCPVTLMMSSMRLKIDRFRRPHRFSLIGLAATRNMLYDSGPSRNTLAWSWLYAVTGFFSEACGLRISMIGFRAHHLAKGLPMKLARVGPPGEERPMVVEGDGEAIDVSGVVDDFDASFLAAGGLGRLRGLLSEKRGSLPRVPLEGLRIGAPLRRPGKVICVGINYRDHARETDMEIPTEPILFGKANNSACGPNDVVLLPPGAQKVDWEVELGVVIGSECRYLQDERAAQESIAGYCVVNDVSEREYQLERGGQWIKGKSSETFNPMGPWLVTADEIDDPLNLGLELWVNGESMQSGSTRDMVFDPAFLVHYISQFMVLEPGDLVNTGTPLGTGMGFRPPRFLSEGDVMDVSITGLGSQRQRCERTSLSQRAMSQAP